MSDLASRSLVIGTRGSKLAMAQATYVRKQLMRLHAELDVELEVIRTAGDASRASLIEIGGQGVFTAEIERALLDGRVDLAVHSLKDLPTDIHPDLELVATPPREDVRDVLVTRDNVSFEELPVGSVLGTGSNRRVAQLAALRSDLRFADIRGNVETRLAKVRDGEVDGVVLAAAGLHRLSLRDEISSYIDTAQMLPAPGQGALGLQMRRRDAPRIPLVRALNDEPTWAGVTAERALLGALGGGCRAPIAAWGRQVDDEVLCIDGVVAMPDGSCLHRSSLRGDPAAAGDLGVELADKLRSLGADAVLERLSAS